MPCYRCGARQVDPDRGESPWKRGVRADRQVLVCPACQSSADWTGELDRCPVCSSAHLVRRLGEVECRDCGYVREPGAVTGSGVPDVTGAVPDSRSGRGGAPGAGPEPGFGDTPGLAEEVELALQRVLGRAARPARIG
jgi:ribosomal protein L37AE/L43A